MSYERSVAPIAPILPTPKVSVTNDTFHNGLTRDGDIISSLRMVTVRLEDFPPALLAATYQPQIELMRMRLARWQSTSTGKRKIGRGFVHPTPAATGGATTGSVNFGTRSGNHDPQLGANRPTEWQISGMLPWQAVNLRAAEVFGPWFIVYTWNDSMGGQVKTLAYMAGKRGQQLYRGKRGMGGKTATGEFAFRYSIIDPSTGRRMIGPMSPIIKSRIEYSSVGRTMDITAGNSRDWLLEVNPNANGIYSLGAFVVR